MQDLDMAECKAPTEIPVAIIGSGPAGIAAAIQLKRMGHEPLVFEKERIGGLLCNAHLVENYPGFQQGIPGPALVSLMRDHLEAHSISVSFQKVLSLDIDDRGFLLTVAGGSILARRAVIASGTCPRKLQSPEIPAEVSDRVLSEICSIRDITGKRVAIVGGGDAAFDYALSLQGHNSVVVISRNAAPRCVSALARRVESVPGIERLRNTRVVKVERSNCGVGLMCETGPGHEDRRHVDADYLIVAIGRRPDLSFLSPRLAGVLDDVKARGLLHLVGDVAHTDTRQTAIAVGDGVAAAMKLHAEMSQDTGGKTCRPI